ncbi:DUF1624 domain-containing protein [Dactylosporangium sp. NBC_01737]|uniref:heparan-alpha-glucosaminide N-acetyltransferase domain-containing protein n=1 Tax=Dactylosporangium sp. NBC_01737 TaxID=2975959 RepID=UPI002E0E02A6|nr:DUF1624 domain-containing protein [Dactylosporangium sp. NBC_01737]
MTQLALGAAPAHPGDGTAPAAAPPKRARLAGVDAARGVSLLGMISLHALYEADAAGNPTWSALVFSGRAAAAFALLSGVSIAFATGRRQVPAADLRPVAAMIAVRALAIGVIGFLLCSADTVLDAVILPYFAVVFLLAIPLVFLRTWVVAAIGVLLATAGPVADHVLLPRLPDPVLGNPTFGRLVEDPAGMLTELTLTGFYPSPTWLAYISAGIVIGRLDLTKVRVAAVLLAGGTALAVWANAISALLLYRFGGLGHIWAAQPGSGLTEAETTELLRFGGDGNTPTSTWWWLAIDAPHTGTPFDILGAAGCAVAVLGLLLLAGHVRHRVLGPLCTVVLVPLAAAGSMTLTFYSAHILFINSEFDTYSAAGGCLVQVIGAVLIALAVRGTVGRGPLEAAVTALATRARRWAASRVPAQADAPAPAALRQAVPRSVATRPVLHGEVVQGDVVQGEVVPVRPPAPRRPHRPDGSRRRIAQRRARPDIGDGGGTGESTGTGQGSGAGQGSGP